MNNLFQAILGFTSTMWGTFVGNAAIINWGLTLAGVLVFWGVMWALIEVLLGESGQRGLAKIVGLFVTWAIVTVMLQTWDVSTRAVYNTFLGLRNLFAGGGDGELATQLGNFLSTAADVFNKAQAAANVAPAATGLDGVVQAVLGLADKMLGAGLHILTLIVMVFFLLGILVAHSFGLMLMLIGFAIGPLLLPWVIWERMSYLTDGLVRWSIVAGMYTLMGAILLRFATALLQHVTNSIITAGNISNPQYFGMTGAMLAALIFMVLMAYAAMQISAWASQIISGNPMARWMPSVQAGMGAGRAVSRALPPPPPPPGGGGGATARRAVTPAAPSIAARRRMVARAG